MVNFHIHLRHSQPNIIHNGTTLENVTNVIAQTGDRIILQPYVPVAAGKVTYRWSDGSTGPTLTIDGLASSCLYSVTIEANGRQETYNYEVYLAHVGSGDTIAAGKYMIRHSATDTYMTNNGPDNPVTFTPGDTLQPQAHQTWLIEAKGKRHSMMSMADSLYVGTSGKPSRAALSSFYFNAAVGINRYALHSGSSASAKYWNADAEGNVLIETMSAPSGYPFELLLIEATDGIEEAETTLHAPAAYYDLMGRKVEHPTQGIYIKDGRKVIFRK